MQFISYLSRGQLRSARIIGDFGFDLYKTVDLYTRKHSGIKFPLDKLSSSLTDLLLTGSEGMEFTQEATDWVIGSNPEFGDELIAEGVVIRINEVVLAAPIPRPGKVICVAGNYPALNKLDRPDYPTIFLKPSSGVIGFGNKVVIPEVAKSVAYEVELAVIIGRRAKSISPEEAKSIIAGYTIANDIGDRLLEKRTSQWTSGKMFDTFTPMGPVLITLDELDDTSCLAMFTRVNDQIKQKGCTSQMFFDVSQLISYISTLTTLELGDVILTGSPKMMDGGANPSGDLNPGDEVEVGIEKLPSLVNPIVSEKEMV